MRYGKYLLKTTLTYFANVSLIKPRVLTVCVHVIATYYRSKPTYTIDVANNNNITLPKSIQIKTWKTS